MVGSYIAPAMNVVARSPTPNSPLHLADLLEGLADPPGPW